MVRLVIDIQQNCESVDTHVYRLDGHGDADVPTEAEVVAAEQIEGQAVKFIENIGGFGIIGEGK